MEQGLRTTAFTLTSGVECEVTELSGRHQRILTEQKNKSMAQNLEEVLVDLIVRIGDNKQIDKDFVQQMLASDRKQVLVMARQFTMDFEEKFTFSWEYTDTNGTKQEYPLEIDLKDGVFSFKPTKNQFATYEEVLKNKKITLTLPRSGQEIQFTLLDGEGELIAANTKRVERSSHTAILMRRPVYFEKTEKTAVPIKITQRELDIMALKDIEFLRTTIKEYEGQVDTEIRFEHPDADKLATRDKEVVVDLLTQIVFFFPSQAI